MASLPEEVKPWVTFYCPETALVLEFKLKGGRQGRNRECKD